MKTSQEWAMEFCNANIINVRGNEVQDFIDRIQKDARAELQLKLDGFLALYDQKGSPE